MSERFIKSALVSIHAPWEGCDDFVFFGCSDPPAVSIHAPWEGCDVNKLLRMDIIKAFQFTHPGKGATSIG